jgi:hypothetical protein
MKTSKNGSVVASKTKSPNQITDTLVERYGASNAMAIKKTSPTGECYHDCACIFNTILDGLAARNAAQEFLWSLGIKSHATFNRDTESFLVRWNTLIA